MASGIEILTLEVGSTITKANGFARHPDGGFLHVAQGFAPTSIARPRLKAVCVKPASTPR